MKISVVYLMPLAMMTLSTVTQAETILKDPIERCKSNIASSKTTGNEIVVPKSEFEKFDACIFEVQSFNFMRSEKPDIECEKIIPAYEEFKTKYSKVNSYISQTDINDILKRYNLPQNNGAFEHVHQYYSSCKGNAHEISGMDNYKNDSPERGEIYDIQVIRSFRDVSKYVDKIRGVSYTAESPIIIDFGSGPASD